MPRRGTGSRWGTCSLLLLAALASGCGANIGAPIDVQPFTIEAVDWSPAWSPDGRSIAYLHFGRPGESGSRTGIWIADTAGASRREIRAGVWDDLDWAPDGTHFVLCKGAVQSLRAVGDSLWTIVPKGARARWSPDGTRLAFHSLDTTGVGSISIVSRDGSLMQQLRPPAGESWIEPDWSPDGTRLVHVRRLGGALDQADLFVMDTTGHGEVRLTSDPEDDATPVWSPDGLWIAWSKRESGQKLWVIKSDGTGARDLFYGEQPSWSPDSRSIAYSTLLFNVYWVYTVDIVTTRQRQITQS